MLVFEACDGNALNMNIRNIDNAVLNVDSSNVEHLLAMVGIGEFRYLALSVDFGNIQDRMQNMDIRARFIIAEQSLSPLASLAQQEKAPVTFNHICYKYPRDFLLTDISWMDKKLHSLF